MVVFLVASMILFAAMAVPVVLTEGRREMEKETIWRGEQYQRAIGQYQRKFRRYPTKVEDLTQQTNGVRFLRKAYTDPMNKEDGSWRFIYFVPPGQLVGSVRQTSLLQNALSSTTIGAGGMSPFGGLQPLSPPGAAAGTAPGATPGPGGAVQQVSNEPQPQPLGGPMIGGNIIGVGSKIKLPSFRLYLGGDTYEKWEFIYNPMLTAGRTPGQIPGQALPPNPGGTTAPGIPLPQAPPQTQPPPGQQ